MASGKKILFKRGTFANIPTLDEGEPGWVTDTNTFYVGDGSTNHEIVTDSKYTAQTVIVATATATPTAMTVAEDRIMGRITGSNINALTVTEVLTMIGALTADYKLFIDAAGTGLEWAKGLYVSNFSRAMDAASGDVAYTGTGFKPSVVVFWSAYGTGASLSVGADNGTNKYCVFTYGAASAVGAASYGFYVVEDASKYQRALVKTMDANGFTLTYERVGVTAAGSSGIGYLALR